MTPEEIRARLAAIAEEFRALHEGAGDRALDETETARWAELETEQTEIETRLTELTDAEARSQRVAESRARWQSLQVGNVVENDDVEVHKLTRTEARDRALKRAEASVKDRTVVLIPEQERKLETLIGARTSGANGDIIARRLLLTENDDYRSAFMKAMTSPTPAWTPEEARAVAAFRQFEERAMNEGTSTSGGFGIPVLIDPSIILTAQQSLNPMRAISRLITITTKTWKGVSSAGVSWSYDAEAAEVSDDGPTLAQPSIDTHMARGFIPFSIELSQDYPGFADEIGTLLAEGKDELEAQKFVVGAGDGSGEPMGIVTALDANTNVEVVVTTDGALGTVDITKVWKALPDRAKGNATWLMGAGTASDLASFGDAYGTRTTDLTGSLEKLRERPVQASSYVPDFAGVTTAANLVVVGDFRKFAIVERAGMSVELIPNLIGTTNNRPTGQRGLFAYARNGSGVTDILAFRLLQNQ
jgi:HK97 family phage major capsid protein